MRVRGVNWGESLMLHSFSRSEPRAGHSSRRLRARSQTWEQGFLSIQIAMTSRPGDWVCPFIQKCARPACLPRSLLHARSISFDNLYKTTVFSGAEMKTGEGKEGREEVDGPAVPAGIQPPAAGQPSPVDPEQSENALGRSGGRLSWRGGTIQDVGTVWRWGRKGKKKRLGRVGLASATDGVVEVATRRKARVFETIVLES
ncbi:hypothetical protein B0J12DRAFT_376104 [Macrophomina phaseolina]|uniref:Uncharacterized protein n=1 Tax=Macrophomina phaseolina TaxID=35725 RepID=A0ABQ8GKG9_9PEZI|nr:hypothetical protein B0J12DRAFT_376104 [Macrophomina phaseolina]